jgi:SAM-dependent methyltransferase
MRFLDARKSAWKGLSNKMDPRAWLTLRFIDALERANEDNQIRRILVLGGGPDEPELTPFENALIEVFYFGIEKPLNAENFLYLDLDQINVCDQKFDLVICNQVIEHLFRLQNAFATISSLLNPNGLLWITAPANNFRHGSPHYYSAGYSREFLEKNLAEPEFVVLESGELSSKRVYLYRHLLRIWPTEFQIRFPLVAYFGTQGSYFTKIIYNLKTLPERILISFSDTRWQVNGEFPIETFGLYKKNS